MKALTLHQPWAHLVATGAKVFETRSWPTKYRGLLAIHASQNTKAFDSLITNSPYDDNPAFRAPFDRHLKPDWFSTYFELSYGGIVAIVDLQACWPAPAVKSYILRYITTLSPQDPYRERLLQELEFGDYGPGRWAWKLDLICSYNGDLVRGRQRLWNLPADLQLRLFADCAGSGIYLAPTAKLLKEAA